MQIRPHHRATQIHRGLHHHDFHHHAQPHLLQPIPSIPDFNYQWHCYVEFVPFRSSKYAERIFLFTQLETSHAHLHDEEQIIIYSVTFSVSINARANDLLLSSRDNTIDDFFLSRRLGSIYFHRIIQQPQNRPISLLLRCRNNKVCFRQQFQLQFFRILAQIPFVIFYRLHQKISISTERQSKFSSLMYCNKRPREATT